MFPKMGNTFPDEDRPQIDRLEYQASISAALKRELGGTHKAIKSVMKWTGVSERTAKNWVAETHGPAGEHLINLLRHSDAVTAAVLSLSGHDTGCAAVGLADLRSALVRMVSIADQALKKQA